MLRLGISLKSILWGVLDNASGHPKNVEKVENKAKKVQDEPKEDQGSRVRENGAPAQQPKTRSLPGSPHPGVQSGDSDTDQNGRGGRRRAPSISRANSS